MAELPGLYVTNPECGHCYKETDWDEGFRCDTCLLFWHDVSSPAEWLDTDADPCTVEPEPHTLSEYDHNGKHWVLGPKQPCQLQEGHTSPCLNDYEVTATPLTEGETDG